MTARPDGSGGRPALLCLQAAGTSSAMFAPLKARLDAHAHVETVDLPGRGLSYGQRFLNTMAEAVDHVMPFVLPQRDRGYAIFGYSMGALIGFALVQKLAQSGGPLPAILIAAAARAPHVPAREAPLHLMDDVTLVRELDRFDGTPPELLADAELMELVLPRLRADFEICETFVPVDGARIPVAVHAIGGRDDEMITPDDLAAWLDLTTIGGSYEQMPGGHFFIDEAVQPLAERTAEILRGAFGADPPRQRNADHG